jgi:hypothetical protein
VGRRPRLQHGHLRCIRRIHRCIRRHILSRILPRRRAAAAEPGGGVVLRLPVVRNILMHYRLRGQNNTSTLTCPLRDSTHPLNSLPYYIIIIPFRPLGYYAYLTIILMLIIMLVYHTVLRAGGATFTSSSNGSLSGGATFTSSWRTGCSTRGSGRGRI